MKILLKTISLLTLLFFLSCSSEDVNQPNSEPTGNETNEQQKEVLDLIKVDTIATTPDLNFYSFLVHQDKLYAVKSGETQVFDFSTSKWSLLVNDTDLPSYYDTGISFIRNGKWNLLTSKGLFEYNFELKDWKVLSWYSGSKNIFYLQGLYIESQDMVYFIDQANGNDDIYKYDLKKNEYIVHSEFNNIGNYGEIHNGAFTIDGIHYILKLDSYNKMGIYKFNEDFSELTLVNNYSTKKFLDSSVALKYGDNIIFGLGGIPSVDNNDIITHDPSNLKFYSYNVKNNLFSEAPTQFYQPRRNAKLITYNNNFYLINGFTIKDKKSERMNLIEKIKFDFVKQ